ncbi:MAG: methyltransferase domain-containing protein [Gramella sp.]|nr:methyltransferase domain-containing protein [Christiangramia sp.]
MPKIDTSRRSDKIEIMDDFDLKGPELARTLDDLDNINAWLGGNKITINGVEQLLNKAEKGKTIRIADIGCGNGTMLRKLSAWGKKNEFDLELTGIDANIHAIEIGIKISKDHPNIKFKSMDIFSDEFQHLNFDIIICTLTLHHFKDEKIIDLIANFLDQTTIGLVINDLHRSKVAYHLFKAFCWVFVNNEIARKDGLISILRGFKMSDLKNYKSAIPESTHSIKWKWAFRYQWIIEKKISIYER